MKIPEYPPSRRRSFRWSLILTLVLGLGLGFTPIYAQDSTDLATKAGKKKHRKRQERPIKLGTSGSNVEDMQVSGRFLYCCNGTLGALVEKNGVQYALSNNHVIGRGNSGRKGEAILQPGYSDQSCPAEDEHMDTVAHLTSKKRVKFGFDKTNKVDLAIAEVVPGAIRSDGEIVQIGVPGSTPKEAFVGMKVKKSGRTTGLTRGVVELVHFTVIIPEFPLDCAGTETRVARFEDQIIVSSIDNKSFEGSGDSGSMVFEDVNECPAPVGLLFAGDGNVAALNPAPTVLKTVKKLKPRGGPASFVGCQSSQMEATSSRQPILRPERVLAAAEVKKDWEEQILSLPSVQGLGVGMTLSGPVEPAIYVYSTDIREETLADLPESLDGFRVEIVETAEFRVRCGK